MDAGDAIIGVLTVTVTDTVGPSPAAGVMYNTVERHEAVRTCYVWGDVCLDCSSQRVHVAVAGGPTRWGPNRGFHV